MSQTHVKRPSAPSKAQNAKSVDQHVLKSKTKGINRAAIARESAEQRILDIFSEAFKSYLNDPEFDTKLKSIKAHFFNREYLEIFTDPTLLNVYSASYAPHRALLFYDLFKKQPELITSLLDNGEVFCLGAGTGAELVGIIAALLPSLPTSPLIEPTTNNTQPALIHIQDMADYSQPISELKKAIKLTWPVVEPCIDIQFSVNDVAVANPAIDEYITKYVSRSNIITTFFILNELLQADKPGFVRLVGRIVRAMRPLSIWVIIDSAGSFSSHAVGGTTGEKREYMAYQFLDMLDGLEIVAKEESCWYRLPAGLSYPLPLQNSRYYYRVFRRI
ncbi:hypothetical protein SmJEL517_g06052 [Synchytrium microbalum]|uniref:Histidine-specific methyltransferase SAM-dependent domain-containing protein n=1 Tax=Synchytrium microbalum TaxID=1806994 RepID=A0A507BXB1_9FUNG|nr:uncharacterized protein SmJEL517_g06052 [Synchytrium microbalum]TPX30366.1 hypothetical protein SmJEL517_g06052 [Synchytrium microbalum]